MSGYIADSFKKPRDLSIRVSKRRSHLARAALWCSLLIFLPLAGMLAIGLSWLAMRSMRNDASITGRRVATLAACMGLLVTATQGLVGYQVHSAWSVLQFGPERALRSAFAGDAGTFKDRFVGAGAFATSGNVADFIGELQDRYGGFVGATIEDPNLIPREPECDVRYQLQFAQATVPAVARVVFVQTEPVVSITNRMRYLRVLDEDQGDLTFPKYAGSEGSVVPPPPAEATASGESESQP
ncbi:MAG: hypothetical protein ACYTGG_11290 [Planctomycetota bacterium]|jgi:hypothetical protein